MQVHLGSKNKRFAEKMSAWAKGNALERQCPKCKRKAALKKVVIVDAAMMVVTCRWKDCGYEKRIKA